MQAKTRKKQPPIHIIAQIDRINILCYHSKMKQLEIAGTERIAMPRAKDYPSHQDWVRAFYAWNREKV